MQGRVLEARWKLSHSMKPERGRRRVSKVTRGNEAVSGTKNGDMRL